MSPGVSRDTCSASMAVGYCLTFHELCKGFDTAHAHVRITKCNSESCIPASDIAKHTEGMDVDKCTVQADGGRVTVGLTGYPNVGKSSTINALFGSKKTAVAPTPGKTKHFQTLNITNDLTLCDCPGLVLPRYAQSKSEMVAAGMVFVGFYSTSVPCRCVCCTAFFQCLT